MGLKTFGCERNGNITDIYSGFLAFCCLCRLFVVMSSHRWFTRKLLESRCLRVFVVSVPSVLEVGGGGALSEGKEDGAWWRSGVAGRAVGGRAGCCGE